MLPHPLANFEIKNDELTFNDANSIKSLPAYVTNYDKQKSMGSDWIALYLNGHNVTYRDNFGVEYI